MPGPRRQASPSKSVVINRLTGVDGARTARGVVVVIDVLRSFTVSAYALAGGARECLLVPTTAEARALHDKIPGSLICVEEGALPVEGIPISNSPTQITKADLNDRVLIQRSSAGTTVMSEVESIHASGTGIRSFKYATIDGTISYRHDPFRVSHRFIGFMGSINQLRSARPSTH